jgi:hypothetical protein
MEAKRSEAKAFDEAKEERANGDRMLLDKNFSEAKRFYDGVERIDPRFASEDAKVMLTSRFGEGGGGG